MEKTRVPKGEKYWYLTSGLYATWTVDFYESMDTKRFECGNYFNSRENADAVVKKLRAVIKGADVIEMPSEEDASFESAHLLGLSGHDDRERREEAYLDGFADCLHWLKSKVI